MTSRAGGLRTRIGRVAVAALCLGALGYRAAGTASASVRHGGSSGTSFTITGAGKGTLKAGPYGLCLNNLVKQNGLTDVADLVGSISGFTKDVQSWSLDVNEKKVGTFKLSVTPGLEPYAELIPSPKNLSQDLTVIGADTFYAKSGKVTLGTESGSISATLATLKGASILLVGKWTCK